MKKSIQYITGALLVSIMLLICYFLAIVAFPSGTFATSYQAAIQRKFDYLVETNEPKIIVCGGSSAAFGINEEYIEQKTGYKIANLGVHAGFGASLPIELSKANINPGDIVVLALEWGWNTNVYNTIGADLVMSGIDNRIDMYQYLLRPCYLSAFLGYLPTYAEKKCTFVPLTEGLYSINSFDLKGRMIVDRPEMIMDYANYADIYGVAAVDVSIDDAAASYLSRYMKFVESRGASVCFAACPTYKDAVACSDDAFIQLARLEEETIGIPYISYPPDYFLGDEYMYDTIYHCNSTGELYRSEMLVNDLERSGILKEGSLVSGS